MPNFQRTITDLQHMHFVDELSARVGEHQICMSFNNDSDAENFVNWWYTEGKELFVLWLKAQAGDLKDE